MTSEPFLAVEWGTARIRTRLIHAGGQVLDIDVEEVRLADLDRDGMAARTERWQSKWPQVSTPYLLSGMIGSNIGWANVPQLKCPAGPSDLVRGACPVRMGSADAVIIPGLHCVSRFDDPDVMRGEEIAALGIATASSDRDALLLSVPGLHGKWIEVDGSGVQRFHTAMTVELHRIIADHSILAPLMKAHPTAGDAFFLGLSKATEGGGLARLLFSARARAVIDGLSESDAADFLWGVLIGADLRENLGEIAARGGCMVSGSADVTGLFCAAIEHLGGAATTVDSDELSAAGFMSVRRAMVV